MFTSSLPRKCLVKVTCFSVIKFVSDLQQQGGDLLWVAWVSSTNKKASHQNITKNYC
jgi:hypothetical protein